MINNIENGAVLSPREKLKTFLPQLLRCDVHLIEAFVQYEKDDSPLLADTVSLLESNWEKAQEKRAERLSAQEVDMMEIIEQFNPKERIIIAKNLTTWQMSDGCTVNCSFCGLMAKREIERSFSLDSAKKFWGTYGSYFPKDQVKTVYDKSDNFDWLSRDGRHSGADLINEFASSVKDGRLFISTAVPEGSEVSIVRSILDFYQKIGEMRQDKEKKLKYFSAFRFSRTKDNKDRIDKIIKIAIDMGIPEGFLREVINIDDKIENCSKKEKGYIVKVGYLIKHPNREEDGADMYGIKNPKGLCISPSGITSESEEIATLNNRVGLKSVKLVPGSLEIAEHLDLENYKHVLDKEENFLPIIPKHTYKVYNDGEFTGIKTVESVRRDAMAFDFAFINLLNFSDFCCSERGRKLLNKSGSRCRFINEIKNDFIPRYEERKRSCLALFPTETDQQAVRIAKKLIGKIDDWLVHMNQRMEINELGKFYRTPKK
jgi:hypothetical protein